MNIHELASVAKAIVSNQKGILAADESGPTIKKRFESIAVESTEASRRRYRETLFTTPDIQRYIGGVFCLMKHCASERMTVFRLLSCCPVVEFSLVSK